MNIFIEPVTKKQSNKILINYIREDKEVVENELIAPIKKAGHEVIVLEKGSRRRAYYGSLNSLINKVSCVVIVFSPLVIKNTYKNYKTLFYDIGFFESLNVPVYPFLLVSQNEINGESLLKRLEKKYEHSILSDKKWVTVKDFKLLMKTLDKYKSMYYFGQDIFDDENINSRISLAKFTLILPVTNDALKEICQLKRIEASEKT